MAKDLIKFSNNKRGFITLLILEALVAAWALMATITAVRSNEKSMMIYGFVTMFATFYIFGRSLRGFMNIVRREREERAAKAGGGETDERQG
ncbi:MAG: hypothetical protein E7474_14880 [Ruminococcaceae bacterium]|nr:hypothetical protein [Oscillospiraceae bacterium]